VCQWKVVVSLDQPRVIAGIERDERCVLSFCFVIFHRDFKDPNRGRRRVTTLIPDMVILAGDSQRARMR